MSKTRFWIGIGVTVLWLILPAMLAWNELSREGGSQLKLNEWGDFFAGFLSPLAFLWLVLGYLQQGEELKNSADALNLQAQELKNAVEQQKELVEASRAQVVALKESQSAAERRRKDELRPSFTVSQTGLYENFSYVLQIGNLGSAVKDFVIQMEGATPYPNSFPRPQIFKTNDIVKFGFIPGDCFRTSGTVLKIFYVDSDDDSFVESYNIKRGGKDSVLVIAKDEQSSVKQSP